MIDKKQLTFMVASMIIGAASSLVTNLAMKHTIEKEVAKKVVEEVAKATAETIVN